MYMYKCNELENVTLSISKTSKYKYALVDMVSKCLIAMTATNKRYLCEIKGVKNKLLNGDYKIVDLICVEL